MFHDVRFPIDIALDSEGGPGRPTEVVELASGAEARNARRARSRRRYNAGSGVKSLDALADIIAFFEARSGRLHAFRWRDPLDFSSARPSLAIAPTDQPLGTGDGAATDFPLIKRYESGGVSVDRPITKPVAGTVRVAVDGVEADPASFTVDPLTGLVSFAAAPAAGAVLTAGFEFDTPVRFDTDDLSISLAAFRAGEALSIPLIEVFE
ncbi:MAG: DUF2460 domain-containing protein [Pseudomonadota bacterium]